MMKKWSFTLKNNPEEISEKLESSLGGAHLFARNKNNEDSIQFKIRKRLLVGLDGLDVDNKVILNGKIFQTGNAENGSNVEISFSKHLRLKLIVFFNIILILGFLAALILKSSSNVYIFVFGGLLLAIGVLIVLHVEKEFNHKILEYKAFISRVLEV
ncbi:hypothetical protein SAMN02927921_03851 [Sinomicrobium oceani]|uniref:DUF423 domain-containing protein n=3 Tax=Sinomicrobium TaxID=1434045 RepID=A0A1K1RPX1_9FLAO|nr:hypothetical protein SAMN02927921_03851 [Sinomicrobium oceani]